MREYFGKTVKFSFVASLAAMSLGVVCGAGTAMAQGKSLMSSGGASGTSAVAPAPIPPVHPFQMDVRDGILTVDGMVGKAQLNYHVGQSFLYFTVPGVGTAIVAQDRFMNALPQKGAFHGNTLTVQVNGHTVELTSASPLESKGVSEAWVSIDPLFGGGKVFPEMGFGNTIQRPYAWPGSKAERTSASADAPPLPASVRPKPEVASAYSVTVPASAPGKGGPPQK
jgi:hypothetical protein